MLAQQLLPQLDTYLCSAGIHTLLGLPGDLPGQLSFLAQGEYNINYLWQYGQDRAVVRVNTGTQIGQLGGAQIAYEAAALRLVGPHAVGPRLLGVDSTLSHLPYGVLAMEYLPGGPLDYLNTTHLVAAAQVLARLHSIPAPDDAPFIRRTALVDDLVEAKEWLIPYLASTPAPQEIRAIFANLLTCAAADAQAHAARFPTPFALVHCDVQAHNWIVDPGSQTQVGPATCHLVDWERPLIDDPTYDLAHFLIPTTTRWKCGIDLSPQADQLFLDAYCAARPDLNPVELHERLAIRRRFILLRALSWCAGAWVEYTGAGRSIDNRDTLEKIEEYLVPSVLRRLFEGWHV